MGNTTPLHVPKLRVQLNEWAAGFNEAFKRPAQTMLVEQVEAALVMLAGAVSDPIYRFIAQISGLIEQVRYISTGLLRPYAQSVYIQGYGHNRSK